MEYNFPADAAPTTVVLDKVVPVHTMEAYSGCRGTPPLIINFGTICPSYFVPEKE